MTGRRVMRKKAYDVRNCQSLFGYAQEVHERSGGVCHFCGAGADSDVSFDLWRQLTVEHLIGKSQGGHYAQIKVALKRKFPEMHEEEIADFAWEIELQNMVTACSFCNSMTSHDRHDLTMQDVISAAPDSRSGVLRSVKRECRRALNRKKAEVQWKLSSVRVAFEGKVLPALRSARNEAVI
jgi:hypothetical protein